MERALQSQRAQWRPRQQSQATQDTTAWSNDREGCEYNDEEDYCDDDDASEDENDENQGRQNTEKHKAQRRRRSGGQRRRLHFEISELQQLYHLPLKTAAERLGICEAALKRICRRNQIKKWPYRQLQSIRRRMSDLEDHENTRPPNSNASTRDSFSIQHHVSDKVKNSGMGQTYNEYRSSFLLPHEMKRDQHDHAALYNSSESALSKSEKLALLEEERQRVISLAHLTNKARRPKPDTSTHRASISRVASDTSLSFEQLLSWSVPVYDSLQDDVLAQDNQQRCPTPLNRDSALLLLANVCSNEEKIRELHARRLTVRRQESDWQQHEVKALTSRFVVANH